MGYGYNFDDFDRRCQNRWPSILLQLGFPSHALTHKDVPCPMCGGKDRFRFSDRDGGGSWYCRGCGHGAGGISLVMAFKGKISCAAAIEMVEGVIGKARVEPKRSRQWVENVRDRMDWHWRNAAPIEARDPAGVYLIGRMGGELILPPPSACRFHHSVREQADGSDYHPAILSRVIAPDNSVSALHITYLTNDGTKADLAKVRQWFAGASVPKGGAVRLFQPCETMGVAEGLETAFGAFGRTGIPTWATLSNNGLIGFEPPSECKLLVIFADRDGSFTGPFSAYALARKLILRPKPVKCHIMLSAVEGDRTADGDFIDTGVPMDFADVFVEQRKRK